LSAFADRLSGHLEMLEIHQISCPLRCDAMKATTYQLEGNLLMSNATMSVNPFRCRMWRLHDRLDDYVTEETCKREIESVLTYGQLVPALGRPLKDDASHDVELIYGARRLFIARTINMPLLVEMREMTDAEAIVAMDIENRQRADVSPYERGLSYSRWLNGGFFSSQGEIARALHISESQVSRLLKLARLPAVIVNAFPSPVDIREEWGLALFEALKADRSRQLIIQAARSIATSSRRPSACDAFRTMLAAAAGGPRTRLPAHDKVVHAADGVPLFRIRQQRSAVAILLPAKTVSAIRVKEISKAIAGILEGRVQQGSFATE
jgi:ParB family transcriptional regulator, chromosome partitioning protein